MDNTTRDALSDTEKHMHTFKNTITERNYLKQKYKFELIGVTTQKDSLKF